MRRLGSIVRMALAAGLLAGCSDILTSRDGELGTFDGTWDGATWRGSAYAVLQGDSLTVVGHRPDPRFFYDEYVQVRVRFDGPGTYSVPESDGMLSKIDGGDAGWMPYAGGTLLVTAYDAGAHRLRLRDPAGELVRSGVAGLGELHRAGLRPLYRRPAGTAAALTIP